MTALERLFRAGARYLKEMEPEDQAALKRGLVSLGTLLGLGVSKKLRKPVGLTAGLLFLGACLPLAGKFMALYSGVEDAGGDTPAVCFRKEEA